MSRETAAEMAEGSAIGVICSLLIALTTGVTTATVLGWHFLAIAFFLAIYTTLTQGGE